MCEFGDIVTFTNSDEIKVSKNSITNPSELFVSIISKKNC